MTAACACLRHETDHGWQVREKRVCLKEKTSAGLIEFVTSITFLTNSSCLKHGLFLTAVIASQVQNHMPRQACFQEELLREPWLRQQVLVSLILWLCAVAPAQQKRLPETPPFLRRPFEPSQSGHQRSVVASLDVWGSGSSLPLNHFCDVRCWLQSQNEPLRVRFFTKYIFGCLILHKNNFEDSDPSQK